MAPSLTVRRLASRVAPVPGETIDSWLEATASRMQMPLGALARRLELPTDARPAWRNTLSENQCATVAAATGVAPDTLSAMTLSSYDGTALRLHPESNRLNATFPFGALTWSRYCPECLNESQGRWQITWRLGWSFACLAHSRLLADCCPSCGMNQRRHHSYARTPTPMLCRCGDSLVATPTPRLSQDHPVIEAQRQIFKVIHGGLTYLGVFGATGGRWPDEALGVIRSLANRVLNYAANHGLAQVDAADLRDGVKAADLASPVLRARNALNNKAPTRAIETAVGVAGALQILQAPSIWEAARRARWLVDGQNVATGPTELRSCFHDDPLATSIIVGASESRFGPELQLRYRTAVTVPCAPDLDIRRVKSIAAALPSTMWPAWSARLLSDRRGTAVLRSTLSCATLLAGSSVKPATAAKLLGSTVTGNAMNHRLWVLRDSAYWPKVCVALIRLSDYLNKDGAPINYARRRRFNYSALLNDARWEKTLHQSWDRLGNQQAGAMHARYLLVERLTGGSPQLATAAANVAARRWLNASPHSSVAAFNATLDDIARSFLARFAIDEPVVWHAPLYLLDDLGLSAPADETTT
jgi:hypothetical protein